MTQATHNPLALPLKALARVLDYPDAELQQHSDELADILGQRPELSASEQEAIRALLQSLGRSDLLTVQAAYGETFDRGSKVSLYVFEHVYGESRDRGPAMIELKQVYREHGLETDGHELPDFLPVVLEFCALLPEAEARQWLAETIHVLQRLSVRLNERDSGYASAVVVLLRLIGADPFPEALTDMAGREARDDTPAAMDQVWAEAPVTFGPDAAQTACGATRQQPLSQASDPRSVQAVANHGRLQE